QPFPELKAGGANPLEDEFWNKGDSQRGEHLYHQVGCVACHEPRVEAEVVSASTSAVDRLIDELDPEELEDMGLAGAARRVASVPHPNLAAKYTRESLTHFLHDPEHVRPSGRMPSLKLTPNEAANITEYLFEESDGPDPVDQFESTRTSPNEELVERGRKLFDSLRCVNCHDAGLSFGESFATDWRRLDVDSPDSCLNVGGESTLEFHLDEFQTKTLSKVISQSTFENEDAAREAGELVEQSLLTLNCYACHEREQLGGVGRFRKPHFEANSLADLGDEGRLPPGLTYVGAKLTNDWMGKVFAGHPSTRLRPHMTIRMPKFPKAIVDPLVDAFEATDEGSRQSESDVFGQHPTLAEAGKQLTQIGCIQCHSFDGQTLPGVVGIDLGGVANRIRPAWFRDFLLDPGGWKRGTRMPSFFPDGVSQSPQVLDGNTEQQIAALWSYFQQSDRLGTPPKIAEALSANYELKPVKQPLMLRMFMSGVGTHAIAVGFQEGIHFAIDAETPRLALAWKEDFVDARSTWFERFTPPIEPLGKDSVVVSPDVEFRIVSGDQEESQQSLRPIFLGYELDEYRIPTFRYRIGGATIHDRYVATVVGTLRRTISIAGDSAPNDGTLQFRLMKDAAIEVMNSKELKGATGLGVAVAIGGLQDDSVVRSDGTDEVWVPIVQGQPLEINYRW
ncbi:MAG: c-type cytochrome, partial [Rhodopirellula bahusiensis]